MEKIYRYPGIEPFSTEQKEVFFGREADVERLYNMVNTNKQTLLYSKSGLGKSSLIQAGLRPKLRENAKYKELLVRFSPYVDYTISIRPHIAVGFVLKSRRHKSKKLKEEQADAAEQMNPLISKRYLDKIIPEENSLWYYAKRTQCVTNDSRTILLMFDQFEELFSYPEEDIFLFKKQLADLLYSDVPLNFRKALEVKLRRQPDLLTAQELEMFNRPLDVKALFSIRDDRMSFMKQLSDYLPDILRIMCELKPLTREQARNAIVLPARASGNFNTEAFDYESDTVEHILNFLTKNNTQPVETTQLQILCNRCELISDAEARSTGNSATITRNKIPNFDNVFIDFYLDVLNRLPEAERPKAKHFIEDELIKKEQRISLDKLVCHEFVSDTALQTLVANHLLRAERNSTGGISYELSHDTLINPILEMRKQRLEREEEEEQLRIKNYELRIKRENEEKERIEKEKQIKLQRKIIAVVGVAAVISVLFGVFGILMWQKAETQSAKFQRQKDIADSAKEETIALYQKIISQKEELDTLQIKFGEFQNKLQFFINELEKNKDVKSSDLANLVKEIRYLLQEKNNNQLFFVQNYERIAYNLLFYGDIKMSSQFFYKTDSIYPGFHNAWELYKLLKNKKNITIDRNEKYEIIKTINDNYSWKMPDDIKQTMNIIIQTKQK